MKHLRRYVLFGILGGLLLITFYILALHLEGRPRKIVETTLVVDTDDAAMEDFIEENKYPVSFLCSGHFELLHGNLSVNLPHASEVYRNLSNAEHDEEAMDANDGEAVLGEPIERRRNDSRIATIFSPENCSPVRNVAIIIPFRNRERHLRILLGHLFPVLQRQLVRYSVFVISQRGDGIFNKGRLMNSGFNYAREAAERANITFNCFIFHDVDLLVEHDTLLHRCSVENVTHLSVAIDKFGYKPICCGMTVGGVLGFTNEQFRKVNGYPNVYWGWGGEDDDMQARLSHHKIGISRPGGEQGRYTMIKHLADKGNLWTRKVQENLASAKARFATDGLSNLSTKIVTVERFPLFIKVVVDVGTMS